MSSLSSVRKTALILGIAICCLTEAVWSQSWDIGNTSSDFVAATLSDGELTIAGSGAMANYNRGGAPWYTLRNAITKVTIQNGVTSAGNHAFSGFTNLTSVTIGTGVTSIGNNAFEGCANLPEVVIPGSVISIGNYAFRGCTSLTSVTIPTSVTSIGNFAFRECTGLTSVTLPTSISSIAVGMFLGSTKLTSVTIPNNVTSIGAEAFSGCTSLISVTIPNSVTSIGNLAFQNCTKLTAIDVGADNANYSSEDGVLFNKSKTTLIKYPAGKQGAYSIPAGVVSVGSNAFLGSAGLTSVTIPAGLISIGDRAFSGCTGLTFVTIPNGVISIGEEAFFGCTRLLSVTIPNSVTSVENHAFGGCTSLTAINVGSDNADYSSENGVLFNKNKTTLIEYPAGKQGAYSIPTGVTSVGSNAFSGCTDLTSVTFPTGVTAVADDAFRRCTGLNTVISLSPVPPVLGVNAFETINKTTACLYVPQSNVSAYSAAVEWKDFTCIGPILTVTFNSQGGSAVSSQPVGHESKVIKPADPVRTGYVLGGWYQNETYTIVWNFNTDVVTSNMTLYAKWLRVYNITFNPLGGSGVSQQIVEQGAKVTKPANPVRTGYVLSGWYKEIAYTTEWNFDTDTVTSDITLYAKWALPVVVKFNSQGGSGVDSLITGEGTRAARPDDPTHPDLFFEAWYRDSTYTNEWDFDTDTVTSNITLYAKWTDIASILSSSLVIPPSESTTGTVVAAPFNRLVYEFTAGPNPVSKSGTVNFYAGADIHGRLPLNYTGTLTVYNAAGNVVRKIAVDDNSSNNKSARRIVGSWDLKDAKGRLVSEGTYLVKGVIKTSDGKSEKISLIVGVK